MYEVLFDDGYMKIVKAVAMSKVKGATTSTTVTTTTNSEQSQQPSQKPSISTSGGGGRKSQPPLPIPKFDLTKFNLLPVPKDGEWCCNWVNDTPIGEEGYLEGPDGHRRPTVLVDDWRLPTGWTKHLYQRSSVSGKWDVVLVGPNKKRFRSKADVKVYLEENGEQYNPDVYDFSIHKRRSKDIGLYIMTEDYKIELKKKLAANAAAAAAAKAAQDQHLDKKSVSELLPKDSKVLSILSETTTTTAPSVDVASTSITEIGDISTEDMFTGFPPPTEQTTFTSISPSPPATSTKTSFPLPAVTSVPPPTPTPTPLPSSLSTSQQLELGFVYVGALKVEIVDNLFRCPDAACNKNFRKENHLQIHVKHYHDEMAKMLGVFPNMTDLACLRTTGQPIEDVIPKNQMTNAQFFEKMHQSDLQMKQIRSPKSMTSPSSVKSDATAKSQQSKIVVDDVAVTSKIKTDLPSSSSMLLTTIETIPKDEKQLNNKNEQIIHQPTNDDILQQKLSLLAATATTTTAKSETIESSFETSFLLQDCIGGYPDPKQQNSSIKRVATNKEIEKDQMDIEGFIETHAVGRPSTNKRGAGRKKGGARSKIKINRKYLSILTLNVITIM